MIWLHRFKTIKEQLIWYPVQIVNEISAFHLTLFLSFSKELSLSDRIVHYYRHYYVIVIYDKEKTLQMSVSSDCVYIHNTIFKSHALVYCHATVIHNHDTMSNPCKSDSWPLKCHIIVIKPLNIVIKLSQSHELVHYY